MTVHFSVDAASFKRFSTFSPRYLTSSHDSFFAPNATACLVAGAIYSEHGDVIVHAESNFSSNSAGVSGGEHVSYLQTREDR